jgi:hypothetical protein
MFNTTSLRFPLILLLNLCVSAAGQQPLSQEQIRHVSKVRRNLAHYHMGTKLDVKLSDGSHKIGVLTQTGSTSFVLVDPVSNKPEAINYLDVKKVQPTRKEYAAQQLSKTARGLPKVAVTALLFVAAIAVYFVVVR